MTDQTWLEVSLEADGEMAEAISEVLARYVSGGVVIESTQIADQTGAESAPNSNLRVYGYLPADAQADQTLLKLQEALWHLGQIQPVSKLQTRGIANLDWSQVWKEHFQPIPIGERLIIVPTWMEVSTEHRIVIKIDPGMAFGTGTHPTTQLCLELIADLLDGDAIGWGVRGRSPIPMIDVGCGSGILGIAALKLGANSVLGVDQDAEAVAAAQKNAAINGVSKSLQLAVGSLEEIRTGKFFLSSGQLVVVNILAPVIIRLLEAGLGEILAPGGKLILSGILEEQGVEVTAALHAAGLNLIDKKQMGDWIALVADRQPHN